MMQTFFDMARPMMFAMPPEEAHELTVRCLEMGILPPIDRSSPDVLHSEVFGLAFDNPIGIAAGFDKDARAFAGILGMGCGFAEIGTVTPRPQSGNPTPRVFRLVNERAVINRLGFNNGGHAAALARLQRGNATGIVGVNIGANKDSDDMIADYVAGLETFVDEASYFTANISSPNTPGLRDLQAPERLDALLSRLMEARDRLVASAKPKRPVIIKLAPDIAEDDLAPVCERLEKHGVDGIAVSNTTLSRAEVSGPNAKQGGGLSGRPLFHRSTVMLARVREATSGRIPLIGIGGIDSGEAALAKLKAGASLIQLYTGLIYEGPGLINRIKSTLADAVRDQGGQRLRDLIGIEAAQWAAKSPDRPD